MRSKFISVEIALHSDHESREWIEWFQKQDNHVDKVSGTDAKWFIYFAPLPSGDVDSTISSLCDAIDELPENIRAHWDNAIRRQFFIGYQAGHEWPCLDNRLSHDTLVKVVGLDAEVRLAIYPASTE